MDTRQIEYIVKIADEKSITRAAEQLFLTQSALSQQLIKLEKELDTRLFVRSKTDWVPTPEGEVYLENARKILHIKQQTYNVIADMVNNRRSFLSIGMTPGRGPDMFTKVYPVFHDRFPEVTVEPRELSVRRQQEEIRKGNLDLGFMTLTDSQRSQDTYIELFDEELLLAVPKDYPVNPDAVRMPGSEGRNAGETDASDLRRDASGTFTLDRLPEISLGEFRYEPFVRMYRESTARQITDKIFQEAGFTPKVLFETSGNHTILSMIRARLCLGIIPWHYVRQNPDGIRLFRLPGHPSWKVCASCRRDAYLSQAALAFIDLVHAYWIDPEQF